MTDNLLHVHGRGSADRLGPNLGYETQASLMYFISLIQWAKVHRLISCLLELLEIFEASKWMFFRFTLDPHIKAQEERTKYIMYFEIEIYHITLSVEKKNGSWVQRGKESQTSVKSYGLSGMDDGRIKDLGAEVMPKYAYTELELKPSGVLCSIKKYLNSRILMWWHLWRDDIQNSLQSVWWMQTWTNKCSIIRQGATYKRPIELHWYRLPECKHI